MEVELKSICICANCGWRLDRATRDNPCPNCGSSFFTVKYRKPKLFLPKP